MRATSFGSKNDLISPMKSTLFEAEILIHYFINHYIIFDNEKDSFPGSFFCLLAFANPVNAQLIIRNDGHAEIGVNPSTGTVTLQGGFSVEQGATFAIYPSSY